MRWVCIVFAFALSACFQADQDARPHIAPGDFALVPCGKIETQTACALAVVGGKRLLFGAPAGVADTLQTEDLRQLDQVFLFSLRAQDLEGLDEIRNASWLAGRSEPLVVFGPEGTAQTVAALNLVFETADALRIVDEGIPRGGYDGALLVAATSEERLEAPVFNTGDVRVRAVVRADQSLIYAINYLAADPVTLQSCLDESCMFEDSVGWPLRETQFIMKSTP